MSSVTPSFLLLSYDQHAMAKLKKLYLPEEFRATLILVERETHKGNTIRGNRLAPLPRRNLSLRHKSKCKLSWFQCY